MTTLSRQHLQMHTSEDKTLQQLTVKSEDNRRLFQQLWTNSCGPWREHLMSHLRHLSWVVDPFKANDSLQNPIVGNVNNWHLAALVLSIGTRILHKGAISCSVIADYISQNYCKIQQFYLWLSSAESNSKLGKWPWSNPSWDDLSEFVTGEKNPRKILGCSGVPYQNCLVSVLVFFLEMVSPAGYILASLLVEGKVVLLVAIKQLVVSNFSTQLVRM